ncbi:hypothetical protein QJS10_CPA05g01176 [Acorus calamus]|uniref:DNA-3-methyladenine glycosylase I n=1 Tax=Acorus calamus TaxID=4465 RepID=A0AAV9EWA3_ACOCL|nr:hypothetical protein QJS10_CPA05g01176 [Acorus calamus]
MPEVLEALLPKENGLEARLELGLAGNRATMRRPSSSKNWRTTAVADKPVPQCDVSADSSCSSDFSCCLTSAKKKRLQHGRGTPKGVRSVKVAPDGADLSLPVPMKRRCTWSTLNSDPLYASFHDEEWGVPVHEDRKLFELLVLSVALAELSWQTILSNRDVFREKFDNFDPASIAKFSEKIIIPLKSSGTTFLSEMKLRAVVDNARQTLEVVKEFGSFRNYCWSFVNNKPIINGFRYARQVPVKTPKAETIT